MIPADVMMQLATLGLTSDQARIVSGMLSAVEAATKSETRTEAEAGIEAGREKARARWHKWKANQPETNVGKRLQPLANDSQQLAPDPAHVEDNLLRKEPNGKQEVRKKEVSNGQFAEFWTLFPNKVGKRNAEREFTLALQRSSFSEIMDGLRRYVAKTDDRAWCNPATFLHQDRWADQPAEVQRRSHSPPNGSDPFAAVGRIFKAKGWTNDEPGSPHRNGQDVQRLPTGPIDEHRGPAVDLRRGSDGNFGPSDR